jgi:epoxyqueuosine reductase
MKNKLYVLGGIVAAVCLGYFVLGALSLIDSNMNRDLIRFGAYFGFVVSLVGIAIAGYFSGSSLDGHTGWERYTHGAGQFFNRKPFYRDKPTYGVTKDHRRTHIKDRQSFCFKTIAQLTAPDENGKPKWSPDQGYENLPEPIQSYLKNNDYRVKQSFKALELMKEQKDNWPKYENRYAIINSWSNAMGSLFEDYDDQAIADDKLYPPEPDSAPEIWDFRGIRREEPLRFKTPDHASRLLKKITHTFGATLVGIAKVNPDWCYQGYLRGVGEGDYEVPSHWRYAVVFGVPHEWDQFYCNPTYGSSFDGYSNLRIISARLESFIHNLGYSARSHVPPSHYDLMMPPLGVDAGLGEQSRMGTLLTPELGANVRLACVTTDIPVEPDKPIDLGIQDFCRKCKICAKKCPSGAISPKDEPEVEFGYKRWKMKDELCFNTWCSVATSKPQRGCRICLLVCPYSRKNNWIHSISRIVDPRDPTGLVSTGLLWMQNTFFKYPKAKDFMPPPLGKNSTYHKPPDWLVSEKWFEFDKNK